MNGARLRSQELSCPAHVSKGRTTTEVSCLMLDEEVCGVRILCIRTSNGVLTVACLSRTFYCSGARETLLFRSFILIVVNRFEIRCTFTPGP